MKIYVKLMFYFLRAFSPAATDGEKKANRSEIMQNDTNTITEIHIVITPSIAVLRRNNPSFANPVDMNDPYFQEMLQEYRGMVGKHKPSNQEDNAASTPTNRRSTKLIDLSKGAFPVVNPIQGYLNNLRQKYGAINVPQEILIKQTPSRTFEGKEPFRPGFIKGYQPQWGRGATRQGLGDIPGGIPGGGGIPPEAGAAAAGGMGPGYEGGPGGMPGGGMPGGGMPGGGMPEGGMPGGGMPGGGMPGGGMPGGGMPGGGMPGGGMPGGGMPVGGMPGGGHPGGMPEGGYPGGMPEGGYPGGMPDGGFPGGMPEGGYPPGMNPEDMKHLDALSPEERQAMLGQHQEHNSELGIGPGGGAGAAAQRFTIRRTTTTMRRRTAPLRVTFEEDCDYIAYYCLKAYDTGKVCGRTMFNTYLTFKNYCMMDYVNCMERYDVWQIVHMGDCFEVKLLTEYLHYEYKGDYFLDEYYLFDYQ